MAYWVIDNMAPHIRRPDLPGEREVSGTGLSEEAPQPELNCRDLGTKPMTDGDTEHQNRRSRRISGLDQSDANNRYEVEAEVINISSPNSAASSVTPSEKKIIQWKDGDPENPYNWSTVRLEYSRKTILETLTLEYRKEKLSSLC